MANLIDIVQFGCIALLPGAVGLLAQLTWPLLHTRRGILSVQAAIGLGYGTQYALLGAWSGATVAWLGGMQTLLILFLGVRHTRTIALGIFPILFLFGVATWSGFPTLLAIIASGLTMLGRMQQDTLRLRKLQLAAAPVGAAHDLYVGALPALAGAVASAIIAALALRREANARRCSLSICMTRAAA